MGVHADVACHRILFLRYISVAGMRVCPSPAGQDHLFLQIVVTGIALGDWAVVLAVVVYLAAGGRAASDDKSAPPLPSGREPFAIVTRLELLRGINPEQANELLAEFHGVSIGYCEAMQSSGAVGVEFVLANVGTAAVQSTISANQIFTLMLA